MYKALNFSIFINYLDKDIEGMLFMTQAGKDS